jgi:hypothetical protein
MCAGSVPPPVGFVDATEVGIGGIRLAFAFGEEGGMDEGGLGGMRGVVGVLGREIYAVGRKVLSRVHR